VSLLKAASRMLLEVFWQQPWEAGISLSPHRPSIMRQQARSWGVIPVPGITQARTGTPTATQRMSNKLNAPNWRRPVTIAIVRSAMRFLVGNGMSGVTVVFVDRGVVPPALRGLHVPFWRI
jgi:hypothetical protein